MEPPRGLEAEGRRAYEGAVATLDKLGHDPTLYGAAIGRYARACDTLATLRRGWVARGRPVVATGSRKSPIAHPLVRAIADQERHVQMLGESLLLTPEARHKAGRTAGRPQGASQSPDRRLRAVRWREPTGG